jgi:hypothetical protein
MLHHSSTISSHRAILTRRWSGYFPCRNADFVQTSRHLQSLAHSTRPKICTRKPKAPRWHYIMPCQSAQLSMKILFAGGIIGVAIGGATRCIPDIKDSVNVHIIPGAFITYPKPSSSKVDAVCQTLAILSSGQTLARCTRTSPVFTLGVPWIFVPVDYDRWKVDSNSISPRVVWLRGSQEDHFFLSNHQEGSVDWRHRMQMKVQTD